MEQVLLSPFHSMKWRKINSASIASCCGSTKGTTETSLKLSKTHFTKFIITAGLPFDLGENALLLPLFNQLNPNFGTVTEEDLLQEASEQLENMKLELRSILASLGKNIALSCDVWCSKHIHRHFLCVTAHWIDSDWVMQRRILDFLWVEVHDLSDDILKQTKECMVFWGISDKVFSFTSDDVTNNAVVVDGLKYTFRPVLDGRLFHSNCVVRVLNSCLENAWEIVKARMRMIWMGVSIVRNNFELFCQRYGYEPKPTIFYDDHEWDTIRELLRTFIPYKDAVSEFVASFSWNVAPDEEEEQDSDDDIEPYVPVVISEHDWEIASLFCRILDVFYLAVDEISENYKPSSYVVLCQLVNVAKLFSELKESVLFNEKFSAMKDIFLKNFGNKVPEIYCVAAVMDPRIKLSGCECLLEAFYQYTDNVTINVQEELKGVSDLLHEMYNLYAVKSTKDQSSPGPANNDHAWSLISGKREEMVASVYEELAIYLQTPTHYKPGSGTLDILAWWKENEKGCPVLSSMARDLLTIPLSTLAPDCAFFLNKDKLIVDKMALKLSESDCVNFDDVEYDFSESDVNDLGEEVSELVKQKLELSICLKDWLNASTRIQGKRELEYDKRLGPDPRDEEEEE